VTPGSQRQHSPRSLSRIRAAAGAVFAWVTRFAVFALVAVFAALASSACGRKGPPLPPLLKMPSGPADLKAERHGGVVDIQFVVPAANTDGTRPANISRIDVYSMTSNQAVSAADVIKFGTKIASVPVKAPVDPNQTIEPDEPEDVELRGRGLDPGARAHVADRLTPEALRPVDLASLKKLKDPKPKGGPDWAGPLLAATMPRTTRVYVGVTVTTKGRNAASTNAVVSMIDAPPVPEAPTVTYDEQEVTIAWPPLQVGFAAAPSTDGVLPSTAIGVSLPTVAYNVYEVSDSSPPTLFRLTGTPVTEPRHSVPRAAWGERHCYAVRAFVTIDGASLEGNESESMCVTFTDTFPPAAPQGLQAVPSEAAISLIWDASAESDIRGYIVLRGPVSAETLEPLMSEPIQETFFEDHTPSGARFAYAVRAVDSAGNLSPPSARVEETAR